MINKKFGKWTVLAEAETEKPGKYFECMCDCGNIGIIQATSLRAGKSTQCKDCMYFERFRPDIMLGKKFGKWTVTEFLGIKNRCGYYKSVCECGHTTNHYGTDLRQGKSTMCIDCHNKKNADINTKHGMHKTKIYHIWQNILFRCKNPSCSNYKYYGARGIKVCERWDKFENFLEDMSPIPEGMTIDRIDNDKGYEKDNCRWVTHKENCNNRGLYNGGKKRKSKYGEALPSP